jgi:hypothetical protein
MKTIIKISSIIMVLSFIVISNIFITPITHSAVSTPIITFVNSSTQQTIGNAYNDSIYNLTVTNTVGSPTYFRAGGDYAVWTRDGSLNSWAAGSLIDPPTAKNTLNMLVKTDPTYGKVIDQGNNQWWDMVIWSSAAWNHYKVTGDSVFLTDAYDITVNSLNMMRSLHYNTTYGLFKGPSFFNDGIAGYEQPYNTDSGSSFVLDHTGTNELMCLSTNCLYYNAYKSAALMGTVLGKPSATINDLNAKADDLKTKINNSFWISGSNRYGYYISGTGIKAGVLENFQEGSGLGFALLFGVADDTKASAIMNNIHFQPKGLPSIWPHFSMFNDSRPGRHNCIIWPQVNGIFAKGAAKRNGFTAFASEVESLTGLINSSSGNIREIYDSISGAPDGGWQCGTHWNSCNHQTWSATAYLGMIFEGIFGMNFETNGITFAPYVKNTWGYVSLTNLTYRGMTLTINLTGTGSTISSFKLDGVTQGSPFVAATLTGSHIVLTGGGATPTPPPTPTPSATATPTPTGQITATLQEGVNGYAGTADAHILEYPDLSGKNTGANDQLEACRYNGTASDDDKSILIKFDVASIPSNATVTGATLELCLVATRNGAVNKTLNVHEVTASWVEGTGTGIDGQTASGVTWSTCPAYNGTSLDSKTIASTTGTWYGFNIKDLAQSWINGSKGNYGVIIMEDAPSTTSGTKDFASSEYATVSQRPKLTVYYTSSGSTATPTPTPTSTPTPTPTPTSGPTATPGVPTSGLKLWLKADVGITKDGSNYVSAWADQSGGGLNATQSTSGIKPVYTASVISGKPVVRFDGSNDYLSFGPLTVNGLTQMTMVLVSSNRADQSGGSNGDYNVALILDETGNWGKVYLGPFQKTVSTRYGTGQASNFNIYTRPSSIGTGFSTSISVKNGTTEYLYVNGTSVGTYTGKLSTIANTSSTGWLGRGGNNTYFNGDVAEVLIYNRALTDPERQSVQAYLSGKYGL